MYSADYLSKKISFLNVFLTFCIVYLHAKTPERWGLPLDMDYPFIYWVYIFTQIGVPTFFFLSGLLFYRRCRFDTIQRKLKSRVYSLLIPYLVWNTFFVFIFYMMVHIPFIHQRMNIGEVLNSPQEVFFAIVNSRYTVLWFVKDLIVFCALSALIYLLLSNLRLALIVLFLSVLVALNIECGYESVYKWFPMYFSGAIVGKFIIDKPSVFDRFLFINNSIVRLRWILSTLIALFLVLYLMAGFDNDIAMFWFRFSAPILIWFIIDLLAKKYIQSVFQVKPWMKYMFFIYCTHQFILNIIQKVAVLLLPPTEFILNSIFLFSPVIVIWLLIQIANYLSRYKIYVYLSGGR